jgi:hypothetical protein
VEKNFTATNEEDLKALLGTCASTMPKRAEFAEQAQSLFADTDVYLRVERVDVLEVRGVWASARVVQTTLAPEGARELGDAATQAYRHFSCLLPKWTTVEYTLVFRRERGKWLVYSSITAPVESGAAGSGRNLGGCVGGTCRFPQVR